MLKDGNHKAESSGFVLGNLLAAVSLGSEFLRALAPFALPVSGGSGDARRKSRHYDSRWPNDGGFGRVKNDSEAQVVDRLFADRQEKERQIQDLELKIDQ
ncbi:unnamed protein product, partial [Cyprideis torosa]